MKIETKIDEMIDRLKEPAYTWSTPARRAYVLTFPVSPIVRVLMIFVLVCAWLAHSIVAYTGERLRCVWNGERSLWD